MIDVQLAVWGFIQWLAYLLITLYIVGMALVVGVFMDRRQVMVSEQWTNAVEQWKAWRTANPKKACTVVAVAAGIVGGWIGFILG